MNAASIITGVALLIMFFLLGIVIAYSKGMESVENDAIENGLAHWKITNKKTGQVKFTWGKPK